jgi:hypothetical protein
MFFVDSAVQAGQVHFAAGMQEEWHGETAGMVKLPGRIHYAVGGTAQFIVGETLQHIAHVHHDLVGQRGNIHPFVLLGKDLQTISRSAYQQGDQVNVFMLLSADRAFGSLVIGG